jgi:hypothetical protein
MKCQINSIKLRSFVVLLSIFCAACGGAREELIAGVKVPVPREMERSEQQGMELALPGFGGGQVSFKGKMAPDQVVEFYRKEMKERGWRPGIGLVSGGGMLSFVKEGQTVMVSVGRTPDGATLTILTGKTGN